MLLSLGSAGRDQRVGCNRGNSVRIGLCRNTQPRNGPKLKARIDRKRDGLENMKLGCSGEFLRIGIISSESRENEDSENISGIETPTVIRNHGMIFTNTSFLFNFLRVHNRPPKFGDLFQFHSARLSVHLKRKRFKQRTQRETDFRSGL